MVEWNLGYFYQASDARGHDEMLRLLEGFDYRIGLLSDWPDGELEMLSDWAITFHEMVCRIFRNPECAQHYSGDSRAFFRNVCDDISRGRAVIAENSWQTLAYFNPNVASRELTVKLDTHRFHASKYIELLDSRIEPEGSWDKHALLSIAGWAQSLSREIEVIRNSSPDEARRFSFALYTGNASVLTRDGQLTIRIFDETQDENDYSIIRSIHM